MDPGVPLPAESTYGVSDWERVGAESGAAGSSRSSSPGPKKRGSRCERIGTKTAMNRGKVTAMYGAALDEIHSGSLATTKSTITHASCKSVYA
jgi:hypothetical protein